MSQWLTLQKLLWHAGDRITVNTDHGVSRWSLNKVYGGSTAGSHWSTVSCRAPMANYLR